MKSHSIITILLTMIMSMTVTAAFAYDIAAVNSDGVIFYYSWRDYGGNELAVVDMYGAYFVPGTNDTYSGNVVIPASVKYQNKNYSVTRINSSAFIYCKGLTSVTIPNTVTSIDGGTFAYCNRLVSAKLGKNLEVIEDGLFNGCYNLKDIYCYADKVPEGYSFFPPNHNTTLHVPAAILEDYKTSWQWSLFTNIVPLAEIEPLVGSRETTFGGEGDAIHEGTDLTDAVIDNTYYSMDAGNGDGYDAESQALVLNSTNTEGQMSTVTDGRVGDDAVRDNYVGIIFELPSWNGRITLDLQTIGSHALYCLSLRLV